MNLTLTRRGDYSVRAAVALARNTDEKPYIKIREVAEEMGIPIRYTPQILGLLAKAGLAEAKAGRAGGYRLSRPSSEITLLDVVEAGEGRLETKDCTLRGGPCHWEEMCAVHPAWEEATQAFRRSLAAKTLESVSAVDRELRRGTYATLAGTHRQPTTNPETHGAAQHGGG